MCMFLGLTLFCKNQKVLEEVSLYCTLLVLSQQKCIIKSNPYIVFFTSLAATVVAELEKPSVQALRNGTQLFLWQILDTILTPVMFPIRRQFALKKNVSLGSQSGFFQPPGNNFSPHSDYCRLLFFFKPRLFSFFSFQVPN